MVPRWNEEVFAILANLFLMKVMNLTKHPTSSITIVKYLRALECRPESTMILGRRIS